MKDLQGLLNECRSKIDDVDSNGLVQFCSDEEMTEWLNQGLALISRAAQVIRVPIRFTTVAGKPQYAFVFEPTDIYEVKYFSSTGLRTLAKMDEGDANDAVRVTGIPTNYYLMWHTAYLAYQDSTNDIIPVPINPGDPSDLRCVLGVYPTPNTSGEKVTVRIIALHPPLVDLSDKVLIPYPFQKAAVHYAVAQALEKEKFAEESKDQYELFNDWTEKLKEYMGQSNSTGHATIKMIDNEREYLDPADRVYLP